MSDFKSVERINKLKAGIEATTGENYNDLTEAVQAMKNAAKNAHTVDGYHFALRLDGSEPPSDTVATISLVINTGR